MVNGSQVVEPNIRQELSNFVKLFSLLGLIVLVLFGAINIAFEGNYLLGYFEFIAGISMGINFFVLKFTNNISVTQNVLLIVILAFLITMLYTGGIQKTGLYWFYVFPVAAFFVAGKAKGIIWISGLYLITLGVLALSWAKVVTIPFTTVQVVEMLMSLFIVSLAIYVYQNVRETATSASLRNKEDLQVERVRVETVIDNIGEGIVALDTEGVVNFVNRSAEIMLGWWQHDLLGKKFLDVVKISGENDEKVRMPDWPLSSQKDEKHSSILKYTKKDGKTSLLLANGAAIIVDGNCLGFVASLHDVAEERAIDRAKSEFMTVASHQLRTPISAISWFSEMLINGDAGKLNEEQEQDVRQIHLSNQRMARLVGDMLIVSRLELKNLPVVPQPVDMQEMLRKVVSEQIEGVPDDQLPTIKEHFDEKISKINIDPDITRNILHNLINNAIKYTPKGGHISLELIGGGNDSKDKITLIISDSGYGIPKNVQNKIFTKFFRAENIRDKDTDGTGLGLFIVKALLEYIGGDISFTSEENQGTIFVVHFPYSKLTKTKQ